MQIQKYGCELELSDWDITQPLPPCLKRNRRDRTIVNSNGVANDPSGKYYQFGGEVNTEPTETIDEQLQYIYIAFNEIKDAKTNYRANFHVHISVDGLADNLEMLKRFQRNLFEFGEEGLQIIDPLLSPTKEEVGHEYLWVMISDRIKHSLKSRHFIVSQKIQDKLMGARTVDEFFDYLPERRQWCNLKSLRKHGTIEFRCFGGSVRTMEQYGNAFMFCKYFVERTLGDLPIDIGFVEYVASKGLPDQLYIDSVLEEGYNHTRQWRKFGAEAVDEWLNKWKPKILDFIGGLK